MVGAFGNPTTRSGAMPMYAFDTLQTAKTLATAGAPRDAVAENTAAKADIDGAGRRFENMDRRFDRIDERLDTIIKRLDKINARLDKMNARLDAMNARLEGMATKADMYRALSILSGAIILANATIAGLAFALAGYIAGP